MLVLFCFLAATPTPKSVAVGLSAVVPMPLGASGAAAPIPRRNKVKAEIFNIIGEFFQKVIIGNSIGIVRFFNLRGE